MKHPPTHELNTTNYYTAPEVLFETKVNFHSDIWSLVHSLKTTRQVKLSGKLSRCLEKSLHVQFNEDGDHCLRPPQTLPCPSRRLGGQRRRSIHKTIRRACEHRGQHGWREIQPISKLPKKLSGDDHHQHQQQGTFKQPATWEILDIKKSSGGSTNGTKVVQHQNGLRRVNGLQRWDSEAKRAPGGIHLYH